MIQNKSVMIWLKTSQLHLGAAGLAVGRSKRSKESLATRQSMYSPPEVTRSGMLEEKPNSMKDFLAANCHSFWKLWAKRIFKKTYCAFWQTFIGFLHKFTDFTRKKL